MRDTRGTRFNRQRDALRGVEFKKRAHSREEMLDVEFVSISVLSRCAVVSRFVSCYSHVSVSAPLPRYVVDVFENYLDISFSFITVFLL